MLVIGAGVAFVATGGNPMSAFDNSDKKPDQKKQGESDVPVELRKVKWENEYTVPLDVKAPVSSDLTADLFVQSPKDEGRYGDYVDYNATKAVSGMTQGVDYFEQTGNGVSTLTFDPENSISPGTYKAAVVDDSSNPEYHTLFTTIKVPKEIPYNKYSNNNAITVVGQSEFVRRAGYDSDTYTIYDGAGTSNAVDFSDKDGSKDLATSAYGSGEETFTVKRTIDYKHGMDYLGEVKVHTVNSTGNVDTTLTIKNSAGKVIFDQTVAQDGSEEDFTQKIPDVDDMDRNPTKVGGELTATYEVTFDGGSVSNGDTLINASVTDVYGNKVGSSPFMSLTS